MAICSTAVALGLSWQNPQDLGVNARRTFWLWYLDRATPSVLIN